MPFIGSITCQYNINIVFYGIVDSIHGIQFIRQDLPDIVQLLFGGDGELFQRSFLLYDLIRIFTAVEAIGGILQNDGENGSRA